MILIIKINDARILFWTDVFGSIRFYTTITKSITFRLPSIISTHSKPHTKPCTRLLKYFVLITLCCKIEHLRGLVRGFKLYMNRNTGLYSLMTLDLSIPPHWKQKLSENMVRDPGPILLEGQLGKYYFGQWCNRKKASLTGK